MTGGQGREPDALAAELTRPARCGNFSHRGDLAGNVNFWDRQHVLDRGKSCSRCGKFLPASEFPSSARTKSGFSSWCRSCHRDAVRKWRAENRDRANEAQRAAYRAAHPLVARSSCEECGVELEGSHRVTCGARALQGRALRRLHPEAEKARQARKRERRKAAGS